MTEICLTERETGTSVVLHRETDIELTASVNSAHAAADTVAENYRLSCTSIITAGETAYWFLERYAGDPQALSAFCDRLRSRGILTEAEAKKGTRSAQLSKLKTIGRGAGWLRLMQERLEPSFTAIYATAKAGKPVDGTDQEKAERVKSAVDAQSGSSKKMTRARASAAGAKISREIAKTEDRAHGTTLATLIDHRVEFEHVAIDLTEIKTKVLRNDPAPGFGLDECLPLNKVMAEHRALTVRCRLSDFPAVETRLMPVAGFSTRPRVLLLEQPDENDITDSIVVVVAQMGGVELKLDSVEQFDGAKKMPIQDLSLIIVPHARSRLAVFAQADCEGWTSLRAGDSWVKEPSLT